MKMPMYCVHVKIVYSFLVTLVGAFFLIKIENWVNDNILGVILVGIYFGISSIFFEYVFVKERNITSFFRGLLLGLSVVFTFMLTLCCGILFIPFGLVFLTFLTGHSIFNFSFLMIDSFLSKKNLFFRKNVLRHLLISLIMASLMYGIQVVEWKFDARYIFMFSYLITFFIYLCMSIHL